MYDLILHIQYLLRYHDCVIMPGVGAFMAAHVPARIDVEGGVITPPSREYTFNGSVANNDGLIANSISRRNGISFAEAQQLLEQQIHALRLSLAENGRVDLGAIGAFVTGEEGRTVFMPRDNAASHAMRCYMKPLSIETVPEHMEENSKPRRTFSDRYYYIAINKRLAHAAACLAGVVLCVAAAFCIPSIGGEDTADYASVVPVKEVVKSISAIRQPAIAAQHQAEDTAKAQPTLEGEYHLIVGTFTTEDEIERFMARHAADGYDLKIIPGEKVTRVAAASAREKAQLIEMMRSDDIKTKFGNTWIWQQSKKVSNTIR